MKSLYKVGIINKVNTEATARPATILDATGPHNKDLPPKPAAKENKPAMVVVVVIMTGTTLLLAA
jgi:hypothetical protein